MNEQVAIIIPSYNEGEQLRKTIEGLLQSPVTAGCMLVVIDDCSALPASEYLKGLPVSILRHSQNLGQGAALRTGMDYALLKGFEYFVHFDADGQHSVADIPGFLKTVKDGTADIVLGSRFMRPEDVAQVPQKKRIVLSFAIWFNFVLTGLKLSDAHNGFRVMNRKAAAALKIRNNRMAHATEILQLIKVGQLRYVEQACHISYSEYSKAKGQSLMNSLNIIVDTLIRTLLK